MHSEAETDAALGGLRGARWLSVGRTLNLVEFGFALGDTEFRLHVQCPCRVVRSSTILLGSTDFLHPVERGTDTATAFDRYETQFDRKASILTRSLADGVVLVGDIEWGGAGAVTLEAGEARIEVFPAVSGPAECWRLFAVGSDEHHVYPPGSE